REGNTVRSVHRSDVVGQGGGQRRHDRRRGALHRACEPRHLPRRGHQRRRPDEDGHRHRHRHCRPGRRRLRHPAHRLHSHPRPASTLTHAKTRFRSSVTGTQCGQSTPVTWSVKEGASGGTVDAAGNYTAPASGGTVHVVATSVADPTKTATATVTVTATPAL